MTDPDPEPPPAPAPLDLSRYVPNPLLLRAELAAELGRLRGLVAALAERVYRQSELLGRRAERK